VFGLSGKVPPSMLGLAYILLALLTHILLRGFTSRTICGMNREVTGARILLSLSPDTGTGSDYPNRTFVGAFVQPLLKQAS
jgi:hypothetical protein